ncbi:MAG: histidine phosphatase family protein [Betaproteobacteria bacterium]|nr:histidine phosphatase family protein [Betaproteobacteria bacterium]
MRLKLFGYFLALLIFSLGASAEQAAGATTNASYARTIYLIRHGAYDTQSPYDPDVSNGLVSLGIAQARLTAARLAGMPVTFDALIASNMKRARETAQVMNSSLPALKLQLSPLLRECFPKMADSERMQRMMKAGDAKAADFDACEAQLKKAFQTYFVPAEDRERHDVLVCHGNVIRYLTLKAIGVDTGMWLNMSVAHTSLTVIRIAPNGTYKVLSVGDVGHLPPNMQSGVSGEDPQLVIPVGR